MLVKLPRLCWNTHPAHGVAKAAQMPCLRCNTHIQLDRAGVPRLSPRAMSSGLAHA